MIFPAMRGPVISAMANIPDGGGHEAAGDDAHHGGHVGHDSATSGFVRILSVRTVVAGLTFFGLGGLAANASGAPPVGSLTIAGGSGFAALYLVGWAMRALMRLRADGTVHIENTIGQAAVVASRRFPAIGPAKARSL